MIINAPIHYRAKAPGEIAFKRRFSETVPLDFREVRDADAPVAVEWEYGRTRWFEGNHYRYDNEAFDVALSAEEKVQALARFISGEAGRDHTPTNAYIDAKPISDDRKFSPKRHPDVAESDGRVMALRKSQALVEDSIIVDGHLWLRCGEPRLVYHPPSKLIHSHVLIDTNDYTRDPERFGKYVQPPKLFVAAYSASLNDMDTIMEMASSYAVPPTVPKFSLHVEDSIGLTDPEALLFEAAVGMLQERGIMPSHYVAAARDSLERLAAHVESGGPANDSLAEILADVRGQLHLNDRDRGDLLHRIVRRWEDRPIGSDLHMTIAPGLTR